MMSWVFGIIGTVSLAIFASLVAGGVQTVFFADSLEKHRERLRTKKYGRKRKRYLQALLDAVRGLASADRLFLLAATCGMTLILVGGYFMTIPFWSEEIVAADLKRIAAIQPRLGADTPQAIVMSDDEFNAELASLRKETLARASAVRAYALVMRLIALGLSLLAFYLLTVWVSVALARAFFEHEIARFTTRMQGLASKAELAALTSAELAVVDEESLKRYVLSMKAIAARHGVAELTRTFELWDDEDIAVAV